jgi:hypothetical protein
MEMADADRRPRGDTDQTDSQEMLQTKLRRLEFYRAEVKHEFNLLSNRLNAYITSQSFLVIAFALSMSNMNPQWTSLLRLTLPASLAILGVITSLQARQGIRGASDVIRWLDKEGKLFGGDPRMDDYRVDRPVAASGDGSPVDIIHERSLAFAKRLPWVFTVAWSVFGLFALIASFKG